MRTTATERDSMLAQKLKRHGVVVTEDDARILRRAELTLHRWAEQECGDCNDLASWAIEREDDSGRPFRCVYYHDGRSLRFPVPDREAGALRRVRAVCDRLGLVFYHQSDPRGCALYVAKPEAVKGCRVDECYPTRMVACAGGITR